MVELLTVAGIISILAAISFALLSRMRTQAVETNAMATLNSLATGYEMYYFMNHSYPQWGTGQPFTSPSAILDHLIEEEFIPRSWGKFERDPSTGWLYNLTQDYGLEIPEYDPDDPTTSESNSYFLILHPYRLQRDALAIGLNPNPPSGWVAVRPRRGKVEDNYRTYQLFVFKPIGPGE
jgi:type II secretory pathway pseudopilin PulG